MRAIAGLLFLSVETTTNSHPQAVVSKLRNRLSHLQPSHLPPLVARKAKAGERRQGTDGQGRRSTSLTKGHLDSTMTNTLSTVAATTRSVASWQRPRRSITSDERVQILPAVTTSTHGCQRITQTSVSSLIGGQDWQRRKRTSSTRRRIPRMRSKARRSRARLVMRRESASSEVVDFGNQ
jgi:hypothetical protein